MTIINQNDKREKYISPACECIEIHSEGILCSSVTTSPPYDGSFGSAGDRLEGEW